MSEFDKHWDTHCISSNCEEDEAKIHFEAGQQSQQAKIDELQKRIDDLEQNKICIRNILEKLDAAESKLNKIAIQAQKKLETFGSALRFKDAVQDILKGNKDD